MKALQKTRLLVLITARELAFALWLLIKGLSPVAQDRTQAAAMTQ